jgi:hypothetical protein
MNDPETTSDLVEDASAGFAEVIVKSEDYVTMESEGYLAKDQVLESTMTLKPALVCSICSVKYEQKDIRMLDGWKTPILYVDDFYEYICPSCNGGKESMKRLSLSWIDVVTITLFNLQVVETPQHVIAGVRYYHWKSKICTFIENNWNLFWKKKMSSTWRNSVASCLSTGTRFISLSKNSAGSDEGLVGLWGLDQNYVANTGSKTKQPHYLVLEDGTLQDLPDSKRKKKDVDMEESKRKRLEGDGLIDSERFKIHENSFDEFGNKRKRTETVEIDIENISRDENVNDTDGQPIFI